MADEPDLILTDINVRHLFATPLIISEMPPEISANINPRLAAMLLQKEKEVPGTKASNDGGWQSDDKILQWGGADIVAVVDAMRQMVNHITLQLNQGVFQRCLLNWKISGWANINRANNANVAHIHPGAYWSAVYYVATDGSKDPAQGGALKLFDPRGGLPLMYCPVLRMGMEGYMTAGNTELHYPRAGQCVIFPSWLSHAVTPYRGAGERISLAFNFSI